MLRSAEELDAAGTVAKPSAFAVFVTSGPRSQVLRDCCPCCILSCVGSGRPSSAAACAQRRLRALAAQ